MSEEAEITPIVSLTELKAYLGLSGTDYDTQLNAIIAALPAYVTLMTGRLYGGTQEVTETHDFAQSIFLNNTDVTEIDYIKKGYSVDHDPDTDTDIETLEPANYRWNSLGRVTVSYRQDTQRSRYNYDRLTVKYSYGVTDVPADIKLAAMMFAGDAFNAIDGEVSSEQLDSYRKSYKPSSASERIFASNRIVNI